MQGVLSQRQAAPRDDHLIKLLLLPPSPYHTIGRPTLPSAARPSASSKRSMLENVSLLGHLLFNDNLAESRRASHKKEAYELRIAWSSTHPSGGPSCGWKDVLAGLLWPENAYKPSEAISALAVKDRCYRAIACEVSSLCSREISLHNT